MTFLDMVLTCFGIPEVISKQVSSNLKKQIYLYALSFYVEAWVGSGALPATLLVGLLTIQKPDTSLWHISV